MPAAIYDLTIEQGADYSKSLVIRNADGNLRDLTNQNFRLQVREHLHSPTVLLEANSSDASPKIVVDIPTSRVTFNFPASETSLLEIKRGVYDLEMYSSSSVVRLLKGAVLVDLEVTR